MSTLNYSPVQTTESGRRKVWADAALINSGLQQPQFWVSGVVACAGWVESLGVMGSDGAPLD